MDDKQLLSGWLWGGVFVLTIVIFLVALLYACAMLINTLNTGIMI